MEKTRVRGFCDGDHIIFNKPSVEKLKIAQTELHYLLDRGYPIKSAVTFVCNHHEISARGALARKAEIENL